MASLVKLSVFASAAAATVLGGVRYGNSTYDYIIVGGGTAGTALATRLSQELGNSSILLIEAGPAQPDLLGINVPGMSGAIQGGPLDWNFTSTPQPELEGRSMSLSRGKLLGGSSAMNYMVWNRASAPEYDSWEPLGNPGWNWSTISSGMSKSENFTGINTADYDGDIARGTEGPIHSLINRFRTEQLLSWVPTMESLGIAHNTEGLGGDPLGSMLQSSSVNPDNYTRSYSANSYLPRAGSNLDVTLSTRVTKINFAAGSKKMTRSCLRRATSEDGMTATGVTLEDGTFIEARKEVILSAGSLQSPGLLEHSGIGQKEVLDAAGIKQIIDLPGVGEHLQDHTAVSVFYQLKPEYNSMDILQHNTSYATEQLSLWQENQVSRFDGTYNAMAFLNWKQVFGENSTVVNMAQQAVGNSTNVIDKARLALLADDTVPSVEVIFADGSLGPYPAADDPLFGSDFVTLSAVMMRPMGRGNVHIQSANISQGPVIDPKYLENEYDLRSTVEAGKFLRKIAQAKPLADFLVGEYMPGMDTVSTDEEWAAYAKQSLITVYHYSGTCAMMPVEDGGVVDPKLRVWGTKNLRVVDASIIPVLIGSHTQTVTYGIAERGAEIIIEDAKAM